MVYKVFKNSMEDNSCGTGIIIAADVLSDLHELKRLVSTELSEMVDIFVPVVSGKVVTCGYATRELNL